MRYISFIKLEIYKYDIIIMYNFIRNEKNWKLEKPTWCCCYLDTHTSWGNIIRSKPTKIYIKIYVKLKIHNVYEKTR